MCISKPKMLSTLPAKPYTLKIEERKNLQKATKTKFSFFFSYLIKKINKTQILKSSPLSLFFFSFW